jgi:hypothetical protein
MKINVDELYFTVVATSFASLRCRQLRLALE